VLKETSTDLSPGSKAWRWELRWSHFDAVSLNRVVQLINKTNQFNLTVRRYTEEEVREVMEDDSALTLQLRLIDRFGDNGVDRCRHRDKLPRTALSFLIHG